MVMATLNHIGIAVRDLPRLKQLFGLLGLSVDRSEVVPTEGVTTHFLPLPKVQASLEFLEPMSADSTIGKFLQKRGPGIHHLSFEVKTGALGPLSEKLRSEGFRLIYDSPKPGAHHMRVNFIHPESAGGMLIEIMEQDQ